MATKDWLSVKKSSPAWIKHQRIKMAAQILGRAEPYLVKVATSPTDLIRSQFELMREVGALACGKDLDELGDPTEGDSSWPQSLLLIEERIFQQGALEFVSSMPMLARMELATTDVRAIGRKSSMAESGDEDEEPADTELEFGNGDSEGDDSEDM